MKRIEIEFDVYKMLTAMLETEQTTYSDVIRRIDMRGSVP
jgi:predicted CopG family antitoxin